jgi:hypothetical protein
MNEDKHISQTLVFRRKERRIYNVGRDIALVFGPDAIFVPRWQGTTVASRNPENQ